MSFSRSAKPSILLIEDNADDERLAIRAFRHTGVAIDITVARDGVKAQEMLGIGEGLLKTADIKPDLIVCDLKMPRLAGDDLVQSVRENERLHDVPCVIFSSSDEAGDVEHCLAKGATGYVVKPVEYEPYLAQVAGIVHDYLESRVCA